MELNTAATLLQLTAGGLGMLESGADPTSATIFETYEMDLARICAAPIACSGHVPFEGDRAFPAQC